MIYSHNTELLIGAIAHFDELPYFAEWEISNPLDDVCNFVLKNPESPNKYIKLKAHNGGVDINIIEEGSDHYHSYWLSSLDLLPGLDTFLNRLYA